MADVVKRGSDLIPFIQTVLFIPQSYMTFTTIVLQGDDVHFNEVSIVTFQAY